MAYFFVKAAWRTSTDRVSVGLEFYRTARQGAPADADVALAELLADDLPLSRRVIGRAEVTDPLDVTPLRVRRIVIEWLRDNAGMTGTDMLEIERSAQVDADFLDRIAALAAS
jgi:hypothetical protein